MSARHWSIWVFFLLLLLLSVHSCKMQNSTNQQRMEVYSVHTHDLVLNVHKIIECAKDRFTSKKKVMAWCWNEFLMTINLQHFRWLINDLSDLSSKSGKHYLAPGSPKWGLAALLFCINHQSKPRTRGPRRHWSHSQLALGKMGHQVNWSPNMDVDTKLCFVLFVCRQAHDRSVLRICTWDSSVMLVLLFSNYYLDHQGVIIVIVSIMLSLTTKNCAKSTNTFSDLKPG